MKDNLLIATKVKKTILYLDKLLPNYPKTDLVLRDNIKNEMYLLLRNIYEVNISEKSERFQMKSKILVNIKMLDFYITTSYNKKIISHKIYVNLGTYFLEIYKMTMSWIKYEESR